ncbi:DNA topoisomerase 3, partial [termite gut metagenome]
KLRGIEKRTYDAHQFLEELKQMVSEIVKNVLSDNTNRRIIITQTAVAPVKKETPKRAPKPDTVINQPCPLCGKGVVIKGKTAYGCSEWKSGCAYRKPF